MDVISQLAAIPGIGPFLPYCILVSWLCSAMATRLPPPSGPSVYAIVYTLINVIGLNFSQARNVGAPPLSVVGKTPPTSLVVLLAASLLALSACSAEQQAATTAKLVHAAQLPAGQLFCKVQQDGGGAMLVAVANAGVASTAPGALPVSIIATGAAKAYVDSVCAQAGGVPAPPPADLNTTVVQMALTALAQSAPAPAPKG